MRRESPWSRLGRRNSLVVKALLNQPNIVVTIDTIDTIDTIITVVTVVIVVTAVTVTWSAIPCQPSCC